MSDGKNNEKKPYPINLEKVFFTRSVVIAVAEHQPGDGGLASLPDNRIDVSPIENEPGRYMAVMRTKLNIEGDPKTPYIVDMECIGLFNTELSPEEAIGRINITGHSVLYGAIREATATITGRQAFGPIMLGLSVLTPSAPPQAEK